MKTLTATAQTKAALDAASAYNAVKVEWGGAVGTLWYSDASRTIDGQGFAPRVSNWGNPSTTLGGGSSWTLELLDDDQAIRDILMTVGYGAKKVTLYQLWPGTVQADWVVIFGGATSTPPVWNEDTGVISIPVMGFDALHSGDLLDNIDETTFPYAHPDAIGGSLPMVYGYKQNVAAIPVQGLGPRTYLTTRCDWNATEFTVKDASDFPASSVGSPIRIWVGGEMMDGYFTDNVFTPTTRPIVLSAGLTLTCQGYEPYGPYNGFNLDANDASGYWVGGCALRFKVYDQGETPPVKIGPYQYRRITSYTRNDTDESEVVVEQPYHKEAPWYEYIPIEYSHISMSGTLWLTSEANLFVGYDCDITTSLEAHDRGDEVFYAGSATGDSYVYIVNDRASKDVERVYAETEDGDEDPYLLSTDFYTVNLDDNQFAGTLGHNVTTITFTRPPGLLASDVVGKSITDVITADVRGPHDGGTLIENPATIIEHIALRGGVASGDIDATAVAAAEAARTDLRCAFAYTSQIALSEALNEIAHQAALAIDWSVGDLRIITRRDDIDDVGITLAFTLTIANYKLDTRRFASTDVRDIANHIRGTYPWQDDQKWLTVRDSGSIDDYGLVRREMATWIYNHQNPVHWALAWYLYMDRYVHDVAIAETFLHELKAEVGDIVEVNTAEYDSAQRGWIRAVTYNPGSKDAIDTIGFEIVVPGSAFYDGAYLWPDEEYTDPEDSSSDENAQDGGWDLPWDGGGIIGEDPPSAVASQQASRLASVSTSRSQSRSRSASMRTTGSKLRSQSASFAASMSQSRSRLVSFSRSRSRSMSISNFPSRSRSRSMSASKLASLSQSRSQSRSQLASLSQSRSRSASVSNFPSRSQSRSASVSVFPSRSQSRSASVSVFPSRSRSRSMSLSQSRSQSLSQLASLSQSRSQSLSQLASLSQSRSQSMSQSKSRSHSKLAGIIGSVSRSRSRSKSKEASQAGEACACGDCARGEGTNVPDTYTVAFSGVPGACADLNDTFELPCQEDCRWDDGDAYPYAAVEVEMVLGHSWLFLTGYHSAADWVYFAADDDEGDACDHASGVPHIVSYGDCDDESTPTCTATANH